MAKITAPLLSFGARGTIAKTATYASWRGVNYARQRVIPANPRSTKQTQIRATFALLREMYKIAPPILLEPWTAFATGRPFIPMNAFIGENVRVLKYEPDMTNFIGSPGALGGPPPAAVNSSSGGAGEIDLSVTVPTQVPDGWSVTAAQACAFNDQAPDGIFTGPLVAVEDTTSTYDLTLTGLGSAKLCIWAAWLKWERDDGRFAYSVGITGSETSGA